MNAHDYEHLAQRDAEEALEQLIEGEYEDGSADCACTTCTVRVVLEAAWPHLLDLARSELNQT